MVFSSVVFLFLFLPLFLLVYYAVPFKLKSYVILLGSYIFYGWWRLDFLILLMVISASNFYLGEKIFKGSDEVRRKIYLGLAIAANLSILFYFKYLNFFIRDIVCGWNNCAPLPHFLENIILPIGLSFFIFHTISYLIDLYRSEAAPADRLVDFCAFIALFPHLVAGPVLRYKDLSYQFRERSHTWEKFNHGACRFFLGLAKKVLIADSVARTADAMFLISNPTASEAWLGALAYTTQLYFDFSGYSSMAVGLAMMMGFKFIENFKSPYLSLSITEFWQRWHISLSTWLRDYLYISLGGNRRGAIRTYINLLLTMLLGGLWHGANWTFVAWGLIHGVFLATERFFGITPKSTRSKVFWLPTSLIIIVGWVFFRSPNLQVAIGFLQGMIGMNGIALNDAFAWQVTNMSLFVLSVGLLIALTEPILIRFVTGGQAQSLELPLAKSVTLGLVAAAVGLLAIIKLIADSDTPFLYFQF